MDKQKEVQEIAWTMCAMIGKPDSCARCIRLSDCNTIINSEKLYDGGFKKSRKQQINLPCMPGDPIYVVDCMQIYKERITGILITYEGIDIVTRKHTYHAEHIGTKLHLSAAAAKTALKNGVNDG